MFDEHSEDLITYLKDTGKVTEEQLKECWTEHDETGKPFTDVVEDNEYFTRDEILEVVAERIGVSCVPDVPDAIDASLIRILKAEQAHKYGIVPYKADADQIYFLAKDPFNFPAAQNVAFLLGRDSVEFSVCNPAKVEDAIIKYYGEENSSMDAVLSEIEGLDLGGDDENALSNSANQAPIIRFVDVVLQEAVKAKASDIHFEPFEDQFRIRYRIDGALYEMAPPPKSLANSVTARVKVMSGLNIAERRIPQDGRIKTTVGGRPIDLRVSTLPTQFGESVVLRILDKGVVNLDLENLTMTDEIMSGIRELVNRPNGIFIVTGPTGSGKTTTLYSALREVNTVDVKILTAEDPVEYEIEGIMQVQINHQVGLTFASALRSFLRQDPDTIMVGEIRDQETGGIAVQAALTGHVVLSTLHTNDAPGAVTRLVDMGLEPFLIAASLEGVLGQRLLRRICRSCKTAYEPDQAVINMLQVDPLEIAEKQFFYGKGCSECNRTGYKGRQGLFELMMINDAVRELITKKAPTLVLKQKAIENGMRTLRDDGLRCIFDGLTTIEEVLKYT
ncbi:GspE/PulE family protein [Candidatus Spyradosoma sp. SGI.093]|uniref:GspE/PulE family protein n=1 Tax=Candidatus Spyradosoma sp. SGI.093 TaxID=3420583 RepID=UPI003D0903B4